MLNLRLEVGAAIASGRNCATTGPVISGSFLIGHGLVPMTVQTVSTDVQDTHIKVELLVNPLFHSRIPLQHGLRGITEVQVERAAPRREWAGSEQFLAPVRRKMLQLGCRSTQIAQLLSSHWPIQDGAPWPRSSLKGAN